MKKSRLFIVSFLIFVLIITSNSMVFASEKVKVGKQSITVDGKKIECNVINDKGRYVITSNDPTLLETKDAKYFDALDALSNKIANSSSGLTQSDDQNTVVPKGYTTGWDTWNSIAYTYQDSNIYKCTSRNTVTFSHPTLTKVKVAASGSIAGYYFGSGTPQSIRLNETLTISALGATFSWPASFSASSSGSSATYQSDPFTGVAYASSPYNGVSAYSYAAIYSYTQNDTAVIRISNVDHRPSSTIYTNWLTGACELTTTGSTTHTSGY